MVTAAWNQKTTASWQESYDKPRQCVEKQRHYSADKGPSSQVCGLPRGHVWLWELDQKEGRAPKNWSFKLSCWRRLLRVSWTERLSNQLIWKEINPEYSLEGLMLKLKLPYFGHLVWTANSLEKVPDSGKDWGQKEKRASEDEMAACNHWCNGHQLGQSSGDCEGWGGLACCYPWGHKELDTTGWLNNNIDFNMWIFFFCSPWKIGKSNFIEDWCL